MEPQNNFLPNLNQPNVPPTAPIGELAPQKPPRFLRLALIILGVLVIAGGAYAFLTYNQQPTTNDQTSNQQPTTNDQTSNQNPTATSTIPADWKTYRNDRHEFEISYPNNWGIVSSSSQPSGYLSVGFGQTNIKDPNYDGEFFVNVIPSKSNSQFEEDLRREEADRLGNSEITKQSVTIARLSGYHFVVTNTEVQKLEPKWMREIIIFERDNNLFLISNAAVRNSLFESFYKSLKFIADEKLNTSDWQTYRNDKYGFEFQYPFTLSLNSAGDSFTLNHSVIYRHPDPCDFRDGSLPRDNLTDFNFSFKIVNKNLEEMIKSSDYPGWNYVSKNPFKLGSLNGYKIMEGVEGCGKYTYYFTVSPVKSLIVSRSIITEFTDSITNKQMYLNIPNIIPPNQEEKYFNQILSTFKFTN